MSVSSFRACLPLILLLCAPAALVHAQLSKIFVASTGNDANDGSRGSPKRNFQGAHDAVVAGGQIVVLDTAGYGALNITKSLAVTVPPGVNGFVTVTGTTNGITVNATAANVALRGLIIEGGGLGGGGTGISATTLSFLFLEDCTVRNFSIGFAFFVNSPANLYMRNCVVRSCNSGMEVRPSSAVTNVAGIIDCRFEQNSSFGVIASTNGNGSNIDMTLEGCFVAGNNTGVQASASNSVIRVSNSTIINNASGIAAFATGQVLSRGNNTLEKNAALNGFPATYSAK